MNLSKIKKMTSNTVLVNRDDDLAKEPKIDCKQISKYKMTQTEIDLWVGWIDIEYGLSRYLIRVFFAVK